MSLCGKFCKCGFKPDLFWFLLMGNIKKCAFDWFKWSDRFLISASKIVVLKHLLERLNMLQLRGSVHEGFVVTWCATLAVVRVSVNNFLNWWGCKREIRPLIHWVGRKEDFFFFIILSGVLSFYRYSLWVFLIELEAYLLEKATSTLFIVFVLRWEYNWYQKPIRSRALVQNI